jgi:hypothetical protein
VISIEFTTVHVKKKQRKHEGTKTKTHRKQHCLTLK